MNFRVEIEQEEDGRWIAEVIDLAGVLAYGKTATEAKQEPKRWRSAWLRIASNTAKPAQTS